MLGSKARSLNGRIVAHCAPTLVGVKPASLISYVYDGAEAMQRQLDEVTSALAPQGIELAVLRDDGKRLLLYVFRRALLKTALSKEGVASFLSRKQYPLNDVDALIKNLQTRILRQEGFPHEIGIFLGYPLEDVLGFIQNKGRHFKYSGTWKVYGDVEAAQRAFASYRACTKMLCEYYYLGKPLPQAAAVA